MAVMKTIYTGLQIMEEEGDKGVMALAEALEKRCSATSLRLCARQADREAHEAAAMGLLALDRRVALELVPTLSWEVAGLADLILSGQAFNGNPAHFL